MAREKPSKDRCSECGSRELSKIDPSLCWVCLASQLRAGVNDVAAWKKDKKGDVDDD